jgi:hypothetical protein
MLRKKERKNERKKERKIHNSIGQQKVEFPNLEWSIWEKVTITKIRTSKTKKNIEKNSKHQNIKSIILVDHNYGTDKDQNIKIDKDQNIKIDKDQNIKIDKDQNIKIDKDQNIKSSWSLLQKSEHQK